MGQLAGSCRLDGRILDLKELVDAERTSASTEERTRYVCHLDGRLDNSDVLLRKLGIQRASVGDDANLALELYKVRGTEGLLDIIGDWSLVLWDPQERALILASDYAGTRPLYYHQGAEQFSWSSSLSQLARRVGSTELDRGFMIESVARGTSGTLTPYRGIHSVPGGGVVRFSSKGIRTGGQMAAAASGCYTAVQRP